MPFDPDAAAKPGAGVFGLPFTEREARVILLPVPFDATTSYGGGASAGPAAILTASAQVDLYDRQFGRVYEQGICMLPEDEHIAVLSERARDAAAPLIEKGGGDPDDRRDAEVIAKVNSASEAMNDFVYGAVKAILGKGKTPGLVGGDHATPFGAIRACAEHVARDGGRLGILHIDAHMDLREAFEGFQWSHASIMHNVLTRIPEVGALVQVGVRDFGEREMDFAIEQGSRVHVCYDEHWSAALDGGTALSDLVREAVEKLPRHVYISFDIDGLDPSLCPHTGTPVPGGLSFNRATALLKAVRDSGRHVVGFDLVEVCPGLDAEEPEWDANVGARVLYKMCGAVMPR